MIGVMMAVSELLGCHAEEARRLLKVHAAKSQPRDATYESSRRATPS